MQDDGRVYEDIKHRVLTRIPHSTSSSLEDKPHTTQNTPQIRPARVCESVETAERNQWPNSSQIHHLRQSLSLIVEFPFNSIQFLLPNYTHIWLFTILPYHTQFTSISPLLFAYAIPLSVFQLKSNIPRLSSDIFPFKVSIFKETLSFSFGISIPTPSGSSKFQEEEMSGFVGVIVSDAGLQSQFTQVELRSLNSKFLSIKDQKGKVTVGDLPQLMVKLKGLSELFKADEIRDVLNGLSCDACDEVHFEDFLKLYLTFRSRAADHEGGSNHSSSYLKASTTTLLHTVSESEKQCYVVHINSFLGDDPFLQQFLPLNPASNDLFELAKDGVLLCKLINVAVPGTIDERTINTKQVLNPWERNENHTLCLNSAKAIGCTVVNIGPQDLVEGRPHLVLGLVSQIIKIQLLADLNLRKTPQLIELADDCDDIEELMGLSPEKVLLKWMNFHLKRGGYEKNLTNFSSDLKDGKAYAYLLNVLAPEHCSPDTLDAKDPTARAELILDHAERMGCKRYLNAKDIVEGTSNLNLAFIAQIFQQRNGLSLDNKKYSFAEMMTDDIEISREERCFRFWINSLGCGTYVNNLFEDVRNGWVLLEALDKVSPGSVKWKQATKPPIKMPFRKVENCNQVVQIGRQLKFSLVNVAGNDFVQGNKKLIIAYLWQLMRYNMLQLLKHLRSFSHGKEITDSDILNWANQKVKCTGRRSRMQSFKDKSLSNGLFFLELLSSVAPRVVNWNLVSKGQCDDEKRLNAIYIISVARKLGCSIFLLPEDIMEVNPKMILTLTASIMYWSLQQPIEESSESSSLSFGEAASTMDVSSSAPSFSEDESSVNGELSALTLDDASSDSSVSSAVEAIDSPTRDETEQGE